MGNGGEGRGKVRGGDEAKPNQEAEVEQTGLGAILEAIARHVHGRGEAPARP